jgi:transcriptional regulator with XRE-family HTH domain
MNRKKIKKQLAVEANVVVILRESLAKTGLRQNDLARALDLSQGAVSQLLSGKVPMQLSTFFRLCELIEASPVAIMELAEVRSRPITGLTEIQIKVMYRSALHQIVYVASAVEIKPASLKLKGVKYGDVKGALLDLEAVGLVKQLRAGIWRQVDVSGVVAIDRKYIWKAHFEILKKSFEQHETVEERDAWFSKHFNAYWLDLCTPLQIERMQTALYGVWELVEQIERENRTTAYSKPLSRKMVNIHLMMSSPLENPSIS